MKSIRTTIYVCIAVLALLLVVSCGQKDSSAKNNNDKASAVSQTKEFTGPERFVLRDIDGNIRKWSEFAGKPVVISFWATWCGPCLQEIKEFKKLYAEYHPKGVEIIGMSVDQERTVRNVVPFVKQVRIPWVVVYADRKAVTEFGLGKGIPMSVFINAAGEETGRLTGVQPESVFKAEFEKMLK